MSSHEVDQLLTHEEFTETNPEKLLKTIKILNLLPKKGLRSNYGASEYVD